jgi:hypothetical protein
MSNSKNINKYMSNSKIIKNTPSQETEQWLNFFDSFIQSLCQTPLIGNLNTPVIIGPSLAEAIARYQNIKDIYNDYKI